MKNKNKKEIKNKTKKNKINKKINNLNEIKKELLIIKKEILILMCELDIHSWVVNGTGKKNGKEVKLRKCKRCGVTEVK